MNGICDKDKCYEDAIADNNLCGKHRKELVLNYLAWTITGVLLVAGVQLSTWLIMDTNNRVKAFRVLGIRPRVEVIKK